MKWHYTLCLLLATLTVPSAARQFQRAVYYRVGHQDLPYYVITADLNNDGNSDLVFGDYLSGRISILLGNGDGTFRKAMTFSVPAPIAPRAGDFDENGDEDLVVVESGGTGESHLAIFLGQGNGKFHKSAEYSCGVGTTSVAVADFNGDGHLDVAVANNAGDVKVFFGTGKGTLKKPATYKISGTPYGIAAGDLNGDKHPDLVVANLGGYVSVLMNDGTGHFKKPVRYDAGGGEVADVTIADLRNNGNQDLVIANASRGMVVLLNNGDGSFGQPTIYVPTCHNCQAPQACVVADFDLDHVPDVACAPHLNDSYVFYGNGDGTFGSGVEIKNTINHEGGYSLATGDFNHDRAPDLAIPIQNYGKVAILINTK